MGQKISTPRFRFTVQELINSLLITQVPSITAADVIDIKSDPADVSYFEVVLNSTQEVVEELS